MGFCLMQGIMLVRIKLIKELATTRGNAGKINYPTTGEVPTLECNQLVG
jgi:hypothetical protein